MDNFVISVKGQPQTIRYFDRETDLPITLGLLVDSGRSQENVLEDERAAASALLDKLKPATATRPADQAFVLQFSQAVELLEDVTDSRSKLDHAIREIGTPPAASETAPDDAEQSATKVPVIGAPDPVVRAGAALYDGIFLAADEIASKQKARRVLVLLTGGVDRNSKERIGEAIEAAQRADTIIYAIYFKGQEPKRDQAANSGNRPTSSNPGGYPGGYPGSSNPSGGGSTPGAGDQRGSYERVEGETILERICGETGGRVFEVSKKEPAETIAAEITDELRTAYRIGFTPEKEAARDGYHVLELKLAGPPAKQKLTLQTRDGYYIGDRD
jgi:VWFA-related protein